MEQSKLYAALGVALQVGCLMAVLAIMALLTGLFLDRALNIGRGIVFICVLGSIPIVLLVGLRVAQILTKRIIPEPDLKAHQPVRSPAKVDTTVATTVDADGE
jgi:hypothetical protein